MQGSSTPSIQAASVALQSASRGNVMLASLMHADMKPEAIHLFHLRTCSLFFWGMPLAGCGFLDTVVKLVQLGADPNAQDITGCTPLQNSAHGTYSALAAVPPSNQGMLSSSKILADISGSQCQPSISR